MSKSIRSFISRLMASKPMKPAEGYDLWAGNYDSQPGNLMLDLDMEVFTDLLKNVRVGNKLVADVGCGTGRHWPGIFSKEPARLIGFDVSAGMLSSLQKKFPQAETHLLSDNRIPTILPGTCDIIVSTLAIAHIANIESALKEWNRILKNEGDIIITDYHPAALEKGANRTFSYQGKTLSVKNYIHPLETIKKLAGQLGWQEIRFIERFVDDQVREYYVRQNALALFDRFKGTPIIYGVHLKKVHDPL